MRAVTTKTVTAPAIIAMRTYGDVHFIGFSLWSICAVVGVAAFMERSWEAARVCAPVLHHAEGA